LLPAIVPLPSPLPPSHRSRQRHADAPTQRVRRRVAQRRVAERGAQCRERRALARAVGALLEMALDFECRLESQFAISVGVD
jgi:hypothetical protein